MNRQHYIFILLIIIFLWTLFLKHLDVELLNLSQMNRCFEDGQIPCRWAPDSDYGYGSPLFNYLPPLPYYFGELIYKVTGSFSFSTKLMYIVPFSVGLLFAWTFLRLTKKVNISNMLLMGISEAFLITTYSLLSLIVILITFIWVIFQYLKKRDKIFFYYLFYSLMIGILLSFFYLLPKIFEMNLIHTLKVYGNLSDYLPIYATESPKEAAKERFKILTGDSQVLGFKQGSNYIKFKTKTNTHTIIRLSQHYFPNWKIVIDGKETKVEFTNNSLGLMTIILGEGEHTIEGKLFDTPIRIISNVITVISLVIILMLFLYQNKGIQTWISYYRKGVGS